jgi:Tfp pilus assembly protein PilF
MGKYKVKKARRTAENLSIQAQAHEVMAKLYRELGNHDLAREEFKSSIHKFNMAAELYKDIALHNKLVNMKRILKATRK